ncbi:unnamed protein product [Euphydryas editha]|uniref:THAP-type domain-containing protein n=1 Tax=Euphydryas editha TaxID=104508 RepID=A0AAU9UB51_EUPED|nr:unnamed protein product [Euphydryas editha]
MAPYKCCVGDCDATSSNYRLFCMPLNVNLRKLWLSLLVPTNPNLLGLTENQLLKKRVCEKHFDQTQFDKAGVRIRYSYPCLFTEMEIAQGIPLAKGWHFMDDHSYSQGYEQESDNSIREPVTIAGNIFDMHRYSLPSTSYSEAISQPQEMGWHFMDDHSYSQGYEQESDNSISKPVTIAEKSVCFNKEIRKYVKQCKKIAVDNQKKTNSQILQSALKQTENNLLMKNFHKLNNKAQAFLLLQLKLATKNKMARRFSLEEKLFALALMKQSPKGYKFLEKMFALPNKKTLARLSNKIDFECGINENIFEYIKKSIKDWTITKKLCSIVFDEMALTPRLTYNEGKDKIIGFVDIAGERKPKLADHALVFMIRGICSSWKQCIAYYFCEGTVSAAELQNILHEMIPLITSSGLKPVALVCDQGSTFRSCFKKLKEATARLRSNQGRENDCTIHIAGQDLFLFHDPPHLLKGVRNNFLTKDIIYEGKKASWSDILYIYDLDSKGGHTKAMPKLTAQHVNPKQMDKMKVKTAAQVLSARTAAMLNYTHALHKRLNTPVGTMETTADVVEFFDNLFDSVNGSPGGSKGKLRCAVKSSSPHQEFWRKSIRIIKNMRYVDTNSKLAKQAAKPRHVRVPSLDGWNTTLESFLGLAKLLFTEYRIEFFYPRLLNQDPLENFFGRIRAINYRNTNPDANTFVYAFKSLVLSNILSPHSKFSNCEEDDGATLIDLNFQFNSLKNNNYDENALPCRELNAPSSSKGPSDTEGNIFQNVINEKVRVQTSAYTAGYICRK